MFSFFFFFNDTATTEIYTLSLHDALPICWSEPSRYRSAGLPKPRAASTPSWVTPESNQDRKSTRLNSSHSQISYAVFCLKKKKIKKNQNNKFCNTHKKKQHKNLYKTASTI